MPTIQDGKQAIEQERTQSSQIRYLLQKALQMEEQKESGEVAG